MDQNRWQEIERIYQAAADLDADERDGFLAEKCRADSELRREVESLLKNNERPNGALLDRPAWDQAGTLLDGYSGAGGMGRVYQGRDSRLGRMVAIKVCARQFSGRFERESRAIASLAHLSVANYQAF